MVPIIIDDARALSILNRLNEKIYSELKKHTEKETEFQFRFTSPEEKVFFLEVSNGFIAVEKDSKEPIVGIGGTYVGCGKTRVEALESFFIFFAEKSTKMEVQANESSSEKGLKFSLSYDNIAFHIMVIN